MKIVRVKWLDIMTYCDRVPVPVAKESRLAECETVGYLIGEDVNKIVLAHSIQSIPNNIINENCVSDFSVIPKGVITSREELS